MLRKLIDRLKTLIETKPAALLYGLAAVLPPVLYAFGASKDITGAVVTIATALAAIITAIKASHADVPVILGSAASVLSAFTAFGLKLSPQATAEILSGLQLALAFAFHQSVTPLATLRQATTLAARTPGASLSAEQKERLAGT
ncbi:MAG TPA: hypothetical protein VIZ43_08565 [Trebonia sp.]